MMMLILFAVNKEAFSAWCTNAVLPQTCYQKINNQWEINKTICNATSYNTAAPECKINIPIIDAQANCDFAGEAIESGEWGYYLPTGCDWVIGGCTYTFYHHQAWGSALNDYSEALRLACCHNSPVEWPCGTGGGINICQSSSYTPGLGNCPHN